MKEFQVMVDITISKVVFVEACNESEARKIAKRKILDDPLFYASSGHYVNHEICDCIAD